MTVFVTGGSAATASSFPAPLPEYTPRQRQSKSNYNHWTENGGGGASSDDEGEDEVGISSEEFEDHNPQGPSNKLLWASQFQPNRAATSNKTILSQVGGRTTPQKAQTATTSPHPEAGSASKQLAPPPTPSEVHSEVTSKNPKESTEEDQSLPLQTIDKLRRMLDDTDYITSKKPAIVQTIRTPLEPIQTAASRPKNTVRIPETISPPNSPVTLMEKSSKELSAVAPAPSTTESSSPEPGDRLWTSKDRQKYKRVQRRSHRLSTPIFVHSEDEESDLDDGLGFVLPNDPVYVSDGEESEESESDDAVTAEHEFAGRNGPNFHASPPAASSKEEIAASSLAQANDASSTQSIGSPHQQEAPPPPPLHAPPNHAYPHPPGNEVQSAQQSSLVRPYNPYLYGYGYSPYQSPYGGPYIPPQQQQQQYLYPNHYPPQWPPGGYPNSVTPSQRSEVPSNSLPPPSQTQASPPVERITSPGRTVSPKASLSIQRGLPGGFHLPMTPYAVETTAVDMSRMTYPGTVALRDSSLAEASSKLNFDSIQKIGLMLVTVALACYSGVSPRSLPLTEYNLKFYENFRLVSLALISPTIKFLSVFDAHENDVNDAVNTFFAAFSLGYPLAFALEVVATTLVRLAVFAWFEPSIFTLAPKVPLFVIPWTLRENHYRPKRITLLAADFCASCVASPIIEEYVKLKVLQWTTKLRKNFCWVKKISLSKHSKARRRRWVPEPVSRQDGQTDVVTANQYVTQMLAACIGFKLCDAGRRILMYTKATDANKSFYAFCRGLFPIHELCGTMTAISLAKRDLLGMDMPLWKLLFPAALIHGMANMRGKKPVFRWGSATPWSEMQLSPLHVLDASTLPKLLSKGFAKLMWLVLLSRVLGYCIKNYYMVNRHAMKRTTRYAGNHSAFSAELATAELLKKK